MSLHHIGRAVQDKTDTTVQEALTKFTEFVADPKTKKSEIKDVFTTVMRTAIIYDDDSNTNWNSMWQLLQVIRFLISKFIYSTLYILHCTKIFRC